MNLYAIFHCQRIVFAILFILTGIYLVLFLIKEIYYLFVPPKQVPEISRSVLEIKSEKSITDSLIFNCSYFLYA